VNDAPSSFLPCELPTDVQFQRALEWCARRLRAELNDVMGLLRQGDPGVHSTLRYALAKELAEYLGRIGAPFCAVYVYGSLMNDSAGPASDIDLIVVVERIRDEVQRLVRWVDLSLSAAYRDMIGDAAPSSLLDAHLVDTDQEREGRGYGAVLSDHRAAPICLWRSTPEVRGPSQEGPLRSLTPGRRG